MTRLTLPALLLLAFCSISLPARAESEETDIADDAEITTEEGANKNKCDRDRRRNCVTNECSTGPGGITDQCRNWCKKQAGC